MTLQPPFKQLHVKFTMVPFKPLSDKSTWLPDLCCRNWRRNWQNLFKSSSLFFRLRLEGCHCESGMQLLIWGSLKNKIDSPFKKSKLLTVLLRSQNCEFRQHPQGSPDKGSALWLAKIKVPNLDTFQGWKVIEIFWGLFLWEFWIAIRLWYWF